MAHELGHWHHHRGQSLFCRPDEIGGNRGKNPVERVANAFAADLLMPRFLFDPLAEAMQPSFTSIDKLANEFRVSRTAAAIRYVQKSQKALLLFQYAQTGHRWFVKSDRVPSDLWSHNELHSDTKAFSILFGNTPSEKVMLRDSASNWFTGWEAKRFDLRCQTVKTYDGSVLVLLHLNDPKMLI